MKRREKKKQSTIVLPSSWQDPPSLVLFDERPKCKWTPRGSQNNWDFKPEFLRFEPWLVWAAPSTRRPSGVVQARGGGTRSGLKRTHWQRRGRSCRTPVWLEQDDVAQSKEAETRQRGDFPQSSGSGRAECDWLVSHINDRRVDHKIVFLLKWINKIIHKELPFSNVMLWVLSQADMWNKSNRLHTLS